MINNLQEHIYVHPSTFLEINNPQYSINDPYTQDRFPIEKWSREPVFVRTHLHFPSIEKADIVQWSISKIPFRKIPLEPIRWTFFESNNIFINKYFSNRLNRKIKWYLRTQENKCKCIYFFGDIGKFNSYNSKIYYKIFHPICYPFMRKPYMTRAQGQIITSIFCLFISNETWENNILILIGIS